MHRLSRLAVLASCSLVFVACGGDDDSGSKQDSSKEKKIDRSGYFSQEQSDVINPKLAAWNEAVNDYRVNQEPCNKEAQQRFKDGATPAKSVECHLRDTKAIIVAIDGIREVVPKLEGEEWRDECSDQLESFDQSLVEQRKAFATLQGDWLAYAKGKPTPKINEHSAEASEQATEFSDSVASDLAEACYTKADRDDAARKAADDAKDAEDADDEQSS